MRQVLNTAKRGLWGAFALFFVLWLGTAGARGATFYEDNGLVSMETENYTSNDRWKGENDSNASGGAYMKATSKKDRSDRLEFQIQFAKTGWYRVYLRCTSTDTGDNDCFVIGGHVNDSGTWRAVDGIKTNHRSWGWDSQAKHGSDTPSWAAGEPVHVNVGSAGTQTFALGSRSVSFKIDKVVLLHKDRSDGPSGTGPPETTSGGDPPPPDNEPPVLQTIGDKTVNEAEKLSFSISATDPDGDPLTYSASGLPSGASFDRSSRTFSWTPDHSQEGACRVTFAVADGQGGTDSETITITVVDVPPPDDDGDGLPDWWEEEYFGSSSACDPGSDPDQDALTNEQEYAARTEPDNPDTDGDGIPDGDDPDPLHAPDSFHGIGGGCGNSGVIAAFGLLAALLGRRKHA